MSRKNLRLYSVIALFSVLLVALPLTTAYAYAETSTIHNDEIYLSYTHDTCEFRYWYKNTDVKYTLKLESIQELSDSDVQVAILHFDKTKADTFDRQVSTQSIIYDIDDTDATDLRHHVKLEVYIRFNYIELGLTVIRWDVSTILSQLILNYSEDGTAYTLVLDSSYYFRRITVNNVQPVTWSDYLMVSTNVSILILTLLSILNLTILLLHRRGHR